MFLLYLEKQSNSVEKVMNLNILTVNELNELLDIIHSLIFIENRDQFRQVVYSLKELIECDYIILGVPKPHSKEELAIDDFNINYPQNWVDLYQEKEFWRIDPIVFAAMQESAPQYWDDIYRKFPPEKSFLRLAYDFGLKNGWTCLARGNTDLPWTILSISGDLERRKNKKSRVNFILQRISPHFSLGLSTLSQKRENKKLWGILTKREREVLKWISQGKTSWEISVILDVAVATINYHVKNINAKLNTVNRHHAVAVATHSGLV